MNFKTKVVIGDPKEKISEVVEELRADLLVMGCRAFGPIKRYFFFLGSDMILTILTMSFIINLNDSIYL